MACRSTLSAVGRAPQGPRTSDAGGRSPPDPRPDAPRSHPARRIPGNLDGRSSGDGRLACVSMDLVVAPPAFLDMTVVGLEGLPVLGQERFAGDLLRSPGG